MFALIWNFFFGYCDRNFIIENQEAKVGWRRLKKNRSEACKKSKKIRVCLTERALAWVSCWRWEFSRELIVKGVERREDERFDKRQWKEGINRTAAEVLVLSRLLRFAFGVDANFSLWLSVEKHQPFVVCQIIYPYLIARLPRREPRGWIRDARELLSPERPGEFLLW